MIWTPLHSRLALGVAAILGGLLAAQVTKKKPVTAEPAPPAPAPIPVAVVDEPDRQKIDATEAKLNDGQDDSFTRPAEKGNGRTDDNPGDLQDTPQPTAVSDGSEPPEPGDVEGVASDK